MFREITPKDYKAIQHITGSIQGFSTPPEYVLWMLSQTQGRFSFVYTDDTANDVLGYVLCLQIAHQEEHNIFCWQIGGKAKNGTPGENIIPSLFEHLCTIAVENAIDAIYFTCEKKRRQRVHSLFKKFLQTDAQEAPDYVMPPSIDVSERVYFVPVHPPPKPHNRTLCTIAAKGLKT